MTPTPTDWNAVALQRLNNVLGEETGRRTMTEVLDELGVGELASSGDLHRFSQALVARGGFAGAVGGLLGVHAVMYGAPLRGDQ